MSALFIFLQCIQACILGVAFVSVARRLRKRVVTQHSDVRTLPTVSLLIPARNEDHALTQSLETALASDYVKLEIIALNDASQDNTSQILRQFAHRGVRFIENGVLPDGWLGKNYALQRLADEASGELLVFIDVDVHYSPKDVSNLVAYLVSNSLQMATVTPMRQFSGVLSRIFSPMTLLWQLMVPGIFRGSKKSSSPSVWIIRKSCISNVDYLARYSSSILPQRYYAQYAQENGGYHNIIAGSLFRFVQQKRFSSLVETRVRSYFPLLRGSLSRSFIVSTLLVAICLQPFIFFQNNRLIVSLAITNVVLIHLMHMMVGWVHNRDNSLFSLVNLYPSILLELYCIVASAISYLVGSIKWKSRQLPLRDVVRDS